MKSKEEHLTREEQIKLIQWCVELRTNQEISELVKDEFEKDITRQGVWCYRNSKKWRPIIKRLRERFEKNILKIPIANKVDRLRILGKVVTEGLKWSLKTITVSGEKIWELKLGVVTQAIKEARTEMEGQTPLVDASTHYHFTKIEDAKLIDEARKKGIDLPSGIEARVGLEIPQQQD